MHKVMFGSDSWLSMMLTFGRFCLVSLIANICWYNSGMVIYTSANLFIFCSHLATCEPVWSPSWTQIHSPMHFEMGHKGPPNPLFPSSRPPPPLQIVKWMNRLKAANKAENWIYRPRKVRKGLYTCRIQQYTLVYMENIGI